MFLAALAPIVTDIIADLVMGIYTFIFTGIFTDIFTDLITDIIFTGIFTNILADTVLQFGTRISFVALYQTVLAKRASMVRHLALAQAIIDLTDHDARDLPFCLRDDASEASRQVDNLS
eukprot:TRINITY_DN24150_c0_g1_i8.p4 TRINITY_DN24150_c0_g1~~TRINITY_DN24150_c0_g1_i8.p4  ORF type:complete len:119 (+),score=28.01 TRINITY_DN24150_c0_g1_i8:131-487(+)